MDASLRRRPRAELRVGDTDRRAVVDEQQRHFIDGRLTSEELGERVAQALNARTFGELSILVADLPWTAGSEERQRPSRDETWRDWLLAPRIGVVLILVGVVALLTMITVTQGAHAGLFPFWPILIWGFFFIGWPGRGSRPGR